MEAHTLYTNIIDTVPVNVLCLVFVLSIALIALAGLYVCEKFFLNKISSDNNEIGGIVFGAISLIYSLVLAFAIVAVWDDFKDLNKTITSETDKLNDILSHSSTLPDSIQRPIKASLLSYCNQVLEKEWKRHQKDDDNRQSAIPALRMMLLQLESQHKIKENIYEVLDEDLSSISSLRRNRMSHSQSHVPDFVWFILKGGSIMLIVFYYFLHVPSAIRKKFYLIVLSSYIAMCMFMVYSLDRPFGSRMQLSRLQYVKILASLKQDNLFAKIELKNDTY